MKNVIMLRKFAIDMIKKGNFNKANLALLKSIKINPKISDTFTLLGDSFYLLNKKDLAKYCYLSSMHLHLNKIKLNSTKTLSSILDSKYDKFLKENINLPSKYGVIIFNNYTIADHLGHSLIDFKKDSSSNLEIKYAKIYKEHIITGKTIETIANKYHINSDDYLDCRKNKYIKLGRSILIKELKWNEINSDDVINLYLKDLLI